MHLAGKGLNNCTSGVGSDCNMVGKWGVKVANIGLGVNEV